MKSEVEKILKDFCYLLEKDIRKIRNENKNAFRKKYGYVYINWDFEMDDDHNFLESNERNIDTVVNEIKNMYNNKEDIQFVEEILSGQKATNRINEKRRAEIRKEINHYLISKVYEKD